jgi:hypothetical protein
MGDITERLAWRKNDHNDECHPKCIEYRNEAIVEIVSLRARLERVREAVPDNWLDGLTGDGAPSLPWGAPEIERLLNGVRDRIINILDGEGE